MDKVKQGPLSKEAWVCNDKDKVYVYHVPSFRYMGFDVKENATRYKQDYIVFHYRPDMIPHPKLKYLMLDVHLNVCLSR